MKKGTVTIILILKSLIDSRIFWKIIELFLPKTFMNHSEVNLSKNQRQKIIDRGNQISEKFSEYFKKTSSFNYANFKYSLEQLVLRITVKHKEHISKDFIQEGQLSLFPPFV